MIRLYKLLMFSIATIFFLIIALCIQIIYALTQKDPYHSLTFASTLWAKTMLKILNISVVVTGQEHHRKNNNYFIVSNHQSYLDVIIIASTVPTLFVAKKDVQSWPFMGWLASLGGTVYINRKAFRGAFESKNNIEKALRRGTNVHIFPEGTSNNGELIFPFKPSLFNAALAAQCTVLPISLNYKTINNSPVERSNRDNICWYGNMSFVDHFWNVLNIRSIEVSLCMHPRISTLETRSSKEVSKTAFDAVNGGFYQLA